MHAVNKSLHPRVNGISVKRANRLRVSWFILGACVGILGSVALSSLANIVQDQFLTADSKTDKPLKSPKSSGKAQGIVLKEKPPVWPRQVDIKVASGDNLLGLLMSQGIGRDDAYSIISSLKPSFNPRDLRIGLPVTMTINKQAHIASSDPYLQNLNIKLSNIEQVSLNRMPNGSYQALNMKKPTTLKLDWGKDKIKGSLYYTAKQKGLPDAAILELIRAYSYDIDFQRDIKQGDSFEVLYEKKVTDDGILVSTGNILFANLITGGKQHKIYRFVDSLGMAHFYNENGENIVKQLLRTPMDGARISSGYGFRRHPVLGYSRMHKGIDFAAGTGTPIFAAGDGVVSWSGRRGDYGNYVMIKHNPTYSTAYGHASRIAPGIRNGARVRQGQIIAYVGATGMATGPHLHYEIIKNGAQINPAGVKFAGGTKLTGKELLRFAETKRTYQSKIASLQPNKPTQVAAR